jgi:four helix bundle protein
MRRAAVSIPSNVAEGFNRIHNGEYRQFLYVTLGSCAELETQIEISDALGYLGKTNATEILGRIGSESRMLNRLISTLK